MNQSYAWFGVLIKWLHDTKIIITEQISCLPIQALANSLPPPRMTFQAGILWWRARSPQYQKFSSSHFSSLSVSPRSHCALTLLAESICHFPYEEREYPNCVRYLGLTATVAWGQKSVATASVIDRISDLIAPSLSPFLHMLLRLDVFGRSSSAANHWSFTYSSSPWWLAAWLEYTTFPGEYSSLENYQWLL